MSGPPSALGALLAHDADRYAAARAWRQNGGKVVGYLGADVPVEMIRAAGLLPLRLRGEVGRGSELAERILGPGTDPPTRLVLAELLTPGATPIDFLLLCHDSDSTVRLYTSLRALARTDSRPGLPEPHFIDLLHLPTETTARYDLDRLAELLAVIEQWAGRRVSEAELAAAIVEANSGRRRLARLQQFRRGGPPLLSGVDALGVIAAGTSLPAAAYDALLVALLDELPAAAPHPGRRIYLTGSGHDSPEVYAAIEQLGAVVVGEDHDWGEALGEGSVDEELPPLAALATHYQRGSPLARRHGSGERAASTARQAQAAGADLVVAWIRAGDDALAWDVPAQRRALDELGIPFLVLERREHPLSRSRAELEAMLAGGTAA